MSELRLVEELEELGVTLAEYSRFTKLATDTIYKLDKAPKKCRKTTIAKAKHGLAHFRARNLKRLNASDGIASAKGTRR